MPLTDRETSDDLQDTRRWWNRFRSAPPAREPDGSTPPPPRVGALVRDGTLVRLRRHTPDNRAAFQRWYADPEIARLLRHDLRPLTYVQSLVYFDTVIIPSSARGLTCAIHDRATDELIGTTGLTEVDVHGDGSCYYRILIGDSRFWNRGYGSEVTRLMMREAFERHGLTAVNLEVFDYNQRAVVAYARVGFKQTGEHTEWPELSGDGLHVLEMRLTRNDFYAAES
jgi:RimJ/RimL family protein N-acetyltransferase